MGQICWFLKDPWRARGAFPLSSAQGFRAHFQLAGRQLWRASGASIASGGAGRALLDNPFFNNSPYKSTHVVICDSSSAELYSIPGPANTFNANLRSRPGRLEELSTEMTPSNPL